jgi:hypothetical protein
MLNLKDLLVAQVKLKAVEVANSGGTPHGTLAQLSAGTTVSTAAAASPIAAVVPAIQKIATTLVKLHGTQRAGSVSPAQRRAGAMGREDALEIRREWMRGIKLHRAEEAQDRKNRLDDYKKQRTAEAEIVSGLVAGFKTFKSPLEKFKESLMIFNNPKRGILKALNVGGIFDKTIARGEFIDKQKSLGVKKSSKEFKQDFENANKFAKQIQANEAAIDAFRKTTGLSEGKMAGTAQGKELLATREEATRQYSKYDRAAKLEGAAESPEERDEAVKRDEEQTGLLEKLVENTTPVRMSEKALPRSPESSSSGGGLFATIGAAMTALGKGLKGLGQGAGAGIAGFLKGLASGITALGKGLKNLSVGVGRGITAILKGIAAGLKAFADPLVALGLGAVALAVLAIGKGLEWAAPFMKEFAPILVKIVDVIGNVFMKAVETIPVVFESIGKVVVGIINAVTAAIEKLSNLDGSNLMQVGAGLFAVAGGMAAFGASQVVGGVGNLVGGFLGAVTPGGSAMDQIIALGKHGVNIEKAGVGVEKLAYGLGSFSKVDTNTIKAISAMPVDKISAMGVAMGRAGLVASKSAENAGVAQGGGASQNVVVAPSTIVNNTKNETAVYRHSTRNPESTFNRHIDSRYSPA